jgi:hypothetical protein
LCRASAQVIDGFEDKSTGNGEVRINPWRSRSLSGLRIPPGSARLFVEPHREVTTINQGTIILPPIADALTKDMGCFGHDPMVAPGVTPGNCATKSQWEATLEIKFLPVVVHPPQDKKRAYPERSLTVIEARERGKVKRTERMVWKLLTNLPVRSLSSTIKKLTWDALRWKIGVTREGSFTQSVQVRPRPRDSSLVAREAPGRESQPVKPSDNPLGREWAQRSRSQRVVNAAVAS